MLADSCFNMLITDACVQTSLQSSGGVGITVIAGLGGFSLAWNFKFGEFALQNPACCWFLFPSHLREQVTLSSILSLTSRAPQTEEPRGHLFSFSKCWKSISSLLHEPKVPHFLLQHPFLHSLTSSVYLNGVVPPSSACTKIQ